MKGEARALLSRRAGKSAGAVNARHPGSGLRLSFYRRVFGNGQQPSSSRLVACHNARSAADRKDSV